MVTIILHCPHGQSEALVRDGHAQSAQAEGSLSRLWAPQPRESPPMPLKNASREEMLHASQEREPLTRPHAHGSRVSRPTVSSWIKKKALSFLLDVPLCSPRVQRIPLPPRWKWPNGWLVCAQTSARLLDVDRSVPKEPSSGRLCRRRSEPARRVSGCGRPLQKGIGRAPARRDFLKVYSSVIPQEQHTAVGKETGETAHVEGWNNTLRKPLARFVHMTV